MISSLVEKFKMYGFLKFIWFVFDELIKRIYFQAIRHSYSQKQEDLIIDKLLKNKKRGFYVDVGAYDPHRFSNTKRFYEKGWRGVNIEPDVTHYERFLKDRPRDTNLNVGIGKKKDNLTFYRLFPDTLSTFSKKEAKEYEKKGFRILGEIKVNVNTLSSLLAKHVRVKKIDFFSIDTEGFDMVVLKSNDWKKFRPKVICIEANNPAHSESKEIIDFLENLGYVLKKTTGINAIFLDEKK